MQPTSQAAMSGGWPSQAGKRQGVVRAGTPDLIRGDYTARRFPPQGSLDGKGVADPKNKKWGPQAPMVSARDRHRMAETPSAAR